MMVYHCETFKFLKKVNNLTGRDKLYYFFPSLYVRKLQLDSKRNVSLKK